MFPDYYLVLPWHFKDEFIEREREMLDNGVGLIFPLPTIEIIKNNLPNENVRTIKTVREFIRVV